MTMPVPVPSKSAPLFGCDNVKSLLPKILDVAAVLDTYKFAAFGINESKLSKEVSDYDVGIPSYSIFRRGISRNKHGVALYARRCFSPCLLRIPFPVSLQLIAVILKLGNKKLIIATLYRPPKNDVSSLDNFYHALSDWLASLGNDVNRLVLMGDFNLCMFNLIDSRCLLEIAHRFNLTQLVSEPTH